MLLPVSICIIAKDSEKQLEKCLLSVNDIAAEIILIDTGSSDQTALTGRKFGAKVYSHIWKNDFSEARNSAFQYVTQPWNLWLDTDEELVIKEINQLKVLLDGSAYDSFFILREEILNKGETATTQRCRLLKTEKNYRFSGVIHETPLVNPQTTHLIDSEIIYIKHYGYNTAYAVPEEKSRRNINVLNQELKYVKFDSWEKIYNAIAMIKELNNQENIIEKINLLELVEQALDNYSVTEIKDNIISLSFYHSLINTYQDLQSFKMAEKTCLKALKIFPDELNLLSMTAEFYYRQKEYNKSLEYYQEILRRVQTNQFIQSVFIHEGLKNYGTLYNIALCYKELKDIEQAISYLKRSIEINPGFVQARDLLNKVLNQKEV